MLVFWYNQKDMRSRKRIVSLITVLGMLLFLLSSCDKGEEAVSEPPKEDKPIVVEVEGPEETAETAEGPEETAEIAEGPEPEDTVEEESPVEEVTEEATEEATEEVEEVSTAGNNGFTEGPITDEIKARINGLSYKADCTIPYEDLRYLNVLYVDFNGETRTGEIICNKAIAKDLLEIFEELYNIGYQIDKIRLVDEYGADDDLSCADDNTSCFNFRTVEGTTNLSKHAMGRAIDINPFYNPYVTYPGGVERISPPGSEPYADRSKDFPHKIDYNDPAYKAFKAHGFTWGGDWKRTKDYQHFQKV